MPHANRSTRLEYQRQWIAKRRSDYLAEKSCAQCGSTERLEIDHIDPAQKITHRFWSWSDERRNAELAKCQVLCSECHSSKTLEWSQTARCGDASMYRRGCRCSGCKESQRIRIRDYRNNKTLERAA